ncbi:MAG: HNH endonuclease [Ignavibacteriales bacterium]|nr:HNH endonuclease [Ignavibacteriales bacterium]
MVIQDDKVRKQRKNTAKTLLKICQTCGKEFEAKHPSFKYCDSQCNQVELRRQRKTALVKLYGDVCSYCGIEVKAFFSHLDHIVPKSQGGTDDIDNLAIACPMCNMAKYTMTAYEYLDWLAYIRSAKFNSPILSRLNNNDND